MRVGLHPLWMDSDPNGGMATYWSALIDNLGKLDRDNQYTVYYTHPAAVSRSKEYRPPHFAARLLRPSSLWIEIPLSLPWELLRRPVDLLHVSMLAPPVCPAPYVTTINDIAWETNPEVFPRGLLWRLKFLIPRCARRATHIITVSEYSKRLICETYDIPPQRVSVTPHGVTPEYCPVTDITVLDSLRKRYDLPERYLLYVGKLQARKNIVRLVKAFKKGVVAAGLPHKLVLIGKRTWMSNDIFETVQGAGLSDRVLVVGQVPLTDLPAFYSGADLFVFPSLAEGFGLPPLEAMACGTAVISSSASSLPEVVGNAGVLIDPYNIDELAESMVELIRDDAKRSSLEQLGVARAKLFSNERMARLTMEAYETAAEHSGNT